MTTNGEDLSATGALLAECLAEIDRHGPQALDAFCRRHPGHADELRARVESLRGLGLVDERTFAGYRVVRTIGVGGMGVVSLVHDERLGRSVALKALPMHLAGDPRARERFRREMRAVARLSHPCLVAIHDVGEADGVPYFTMDRIDGLALDDVITRLGTLGRRPDSLDADDLWDAAEVAARPDGVRSYAEACVRFVLDVADALEHAHERGVVHRDVKPANVMIRRDDGRAMLLDFGLAHLADAAGPTRSGDVTGTPAYMAPEQLAGDADVDARADVFALAAVATELLTLRRAPAPGRDGRRDVAAALRAPDVRIPRDLATVLRHALAEHRDDRYPDAAAFADDLRRLLALEPIRVRPPSASTVVARFVRRRPAATLAAVLALVVVVGLPILLQTSRAAIAEQRDIARAHLLDARREAARSRALLEQADALNAMILEILSAPGRDGHGLDVRLGDMLAHASAHAGDGGWVGFEIALRNALGATYLQLGELGEARAEFERVLALDALDLDPSQHLATLSNFGILECRSGRTDAGVDLFERALAVAEDAGLTTSGSYAQTLTNLAGVVIGRGDLDRGAALLEEAVEVHAALGDAAGSIDTRINLAMLRDEQGRDDEARALAEALLPDARRVLGPGAENTAVLAGNLAALRHADGDTARAESLIAETIEAVVAERDDDDPRVAKLRTQRAELLVALRRHAAAAAEAQRALGGLPLLEPDGGPLTLLALGSLVDALAALGDVDAALDVARTAVAIETSIPDLTPAQRWAAVERAAELLDARGEIDEGVALLTALLARVDAASEAARSAEARLDELRPRGG